MSYTERDICRVCSGKLENILDLGMIYQNDFIPDDTNIIKSPLVLVKCNKCDLVQLGHDFNMDSLYRQYWYKSSLNKSMVNSLQDIINTVIDYDILKDDDVVVDIGANDGTLLSLYPKNVIKIGFDPALNLAEEAKQHCNYFINDYFSAATYPIEKKAKVITSIAMFYDLENPRAFISDIKTLLDPTGIWIIQFTDLLSMFKINAFDNICHEHLEYYSLEVMCNLLQSEGLEPINISYNNVNGGSIRLTVAFPNTYFPKDIDKARKDELLYMKQFDNPFTAFADRINIIKDKITNFIDSILGHGAKIYVMGASTKGNTLLQYFNIDNTKIPLAAEVNKDKFGLKTVGTNIKIIPEYQALNDNPDYFLILPWHFIETFKVSLTPYLEKGGKLLIPMPEPCILSKDGVTLL